MNLFGDQYPNAPGFKKGVTSRSNMASRMAAQGIKKSGRHGTLREAVLAWFRAGHKGTADECAIALGESVNSIRPRVCELLALKEIKDTGRTRRATGGREAQVWEIV